MDGNNERCGPRLAPDAPRGIFKFDLSCMISSDLHAKRPPMSSIYATDVAAVPGCFGVDGRFDETLEGCGLRNFVRKDFDLSRVEF